MCPSICLLEHILHSTSITFHSTSNKNLTTLHALSATFDNQLIDDCPRFHTIKSPLKKQHHSIRKPLTTAVTSTSSHFLQTSLPKLQTPREKIGREMSFGTTLHLARTSTLTSGIPSFSYLAWNSPRSICYIRSLRETPSRSAIAACQTSNKTSMASTNP